MWGTAHINMHTQTTRLASIPLPTFLQAQSCQAGYVGNPACLLTHGGAGGNGQLEPRVTLVQDGGGVAVSAHAIRLSPSRMDTS